MSRLVEFDDLILLDVHDLRAVIDAVSPATFVEALAGISLALRRSLLSKLPPVIVARYDASIQELGSVDSEASHLAQRQIVDTLCRLGRGGVIAFDDPFDMYPESLVA